MSVMAPFTIPVPWSLVDEYITSLEARAAAMVADTERGAATSAALDQQVASTRQFLSQNCVSPTDEGALYVLLVGVVHAGLVVEQVLGDDEDARRAADAVKAILNTAGLRLAVLAREARGARGGEAA